MKRDFIYRVANWPFEAQPVANAIIQLATFLIVLVLI